MESTPYLKIKFSDALGPVQYELEIYHGLTSEDLVFANEDYKIVNGQTLYVLPGTTLEQKKFKLLTEKFDLKKTMDISKADAVIGGEKKPYLKIERVLQVSIKNRTLGTNFIEEASNINSAKMQAFLAVNKAINLIVPYISNWTDNGKLLERHSLLRNNAFENKRLFLKANPFSNDKIIYNDTSLLEHQINRKGIIFDQEVCLNMGRMLQSPDKDNRELILEILNNCDYNESALYILVLLKEFQQEFNRLPLTRKGFKTMLVYLHIDRNRIGFLTTDDIICSLKSMNKYTAKHLEQLVTIQKHLLSSIVGLDTTTTLCIDDADELDL